MKALEEDLARKHVLCLDRVTSQTNQKHAHKKTLAQRGSVFSHERGQGQRHYYGSTAGFFLHLKSDTSQDHVLKYPRTPNSTCSQNVFVQIYDRSL